MPRLLILITFVLAAATGPLVAAQAVVPSTTAPGADAPPGPRPLETCQVIARIDNQVILASEILWQVNLIVGDNMDRIPAEHIDEARDQIMQNQLRSLLETKLLYADFVRASKGADMEAIRQQLEQPFLAGGTTGDSPGTVPALMKMFKTKTTQELDAKLRELGTSLQDRRDAFAERAIASQWLREKITLDKPTHDELVAYYQQHLEEYAFPTQARWEEIMVHREDGGDASARQKLVAAGNLAWDRVKSQPNSPQPLLGDIARQHSEAYNAGEGGLNDWTTQGALRDESLDLALFTLPIGALSPILESSLGLHIVRVVERREAGHTPFLEVQDDIREELTNQRYGAEVQKVLSGLKRETRIWTVYTGDTTAEAFLASPTGPTRR